MTTTETPATTHPTTTGRTAVHRSFTLERTLPVAPAVVFAAFADAEQKQAWFHGPDDWDRRDQTFDFRPGGSETVTSVPPGGPAHRFTCHYYDVVADERIVYAYSMDQDDRRGSLSVATIELAPVDGGTRLTMTEQGTFLDGIHDPDERVEGTNALLDQVTAAVTA